MSIVTKRGDGGQTDLAGGIRVSKTHPRVGCHGTIDELVSQMGFARSICRDAAVKQKIESIQRELYKVGSAIAIPPESKKTPPKISAATVDAQARLVESREGINSSLRTAETAGPRWSRAW